MFEYLAKQRRQLRRGTRAFTREVDCGEARIFVDHGFAWDGANNVWLTRARGTFVMDAGPDFDVRPRGFWSRALGFTQGTPSGDPCFDDFFVVRTESSTTWRALTTRARSLLAGSFEDARLMSDGRMVTLWREGDFGFEVDANAAVEVVAEIVQLGTDALASLKRVTGCEYAPAHGPWDERSPPRIALHLPNRVEVRPVAYGDHPGLSASAACGRRMTDFTIAFDDGGYPQSRAPRMSSDVIEAIGRLHPHVLQCRAGRIELCWQHTRLSREQMLAGAHAVANLARPESGLYR